MAILDAKLPARQASTKAVTPTKVEAKTLEGKAPLAIDGGGLGTAIRVLLKDQVKQEQNGLFEVSRNEAFAGEGTFAGSGKFAVGSEWTLTRTADADSSGEVTEGMLVPVEDGATNRKTSWIQRTAGPIEVGVTAQTFEPLVAGALGTAGGDLTGSYSEPTIAEAVIDNSKVKASAAIKGSKLDLKEQVASTDLAASSKELFPRLASAGAVTIGAGLVELEYPGGSAETTAVEVSHGLGQTPTAVIITGEGADLFASRSYTTAKFTAAAHIVEGAAPGKGAKVKARWIAFG